MSGASQCWQSLSVGSFSHEAYSFRSSFHTEPICLPFWFELELSRVFSAAKSLRNQILTETEHATLQQKVFQAKR